MERERITTGVGSLPHENVREAVNFSLKFDIPFLPELPKLGDDMIDSVDNGKEPSCLTYFKEQIIRRQIEAVKIQVIGPVTFLVARYEKYKDVKNKEDVVVNKIGDFLYNMMHGLEAKETTLFLDEPALGSVSIDFQKLWEPIFGSFKVIPGVHCCGNMDWDVLFKSPLIEFISFDASQYDITSYPHYGNGKKVAWGIECKEDVKDFKKGDLIHFPCGMSPLKYKASECEPKLKMLQQIRKELLKV